MYSVSIKSFPVYKHLLQENYVEYAGYAGRKILETKLSNGKKNVFVFHVVFL
jgi:hypothetical protein